MFFWLRRLSNGFERRGNGGLTLGASVGGGALSAGAARVRVMRGVGSARLRVAWMMRGWVDARVWREPLRYATQCRLAFFIIIKH